MTTNPKDFFQQIQNLCEELALQVQLIRNRLSEFLTVGLADSTYLKKSEKASAASTADTAARATADSDGSKFSTTYLKRSDADNKYLGKYERADSAKTADTATEAARATVADIATIANRATTAIQDGNGDDISATYLKSATAASTYLKSATAASTYVSKSTADTTYLGKAAKAASAAKADTATTAVSATKATQDGNGANIADTYMKKSSITYGTTDLDAGTSSLATGSIYVMYE